MKHPKFVLWGLVGLFSSLPFACTDPGGGGGVEDRNIAFDNSEVDFDIVNAFDYLNKKIGKGDWSFENQAKILFEYAVNHQKAINLNNISLASEKVTSFGVSKVEEKIIEDEMELLNSYFFKHGPGPKALALIRNYKNSLRQRMYNQLNEAGLNVLKNHVAVLEFLSGTAVGKTFYENMVAFENGQFQFQPQSFKESGLVSNSASPAECALWVTFLAAAIAKCAALNPLACVAVAYYTAKLVDKCPGWGPVVNPCAGSTNPCCGVWCAPWAGCINGQCIPGVDPDQPVCPDGGYWSVFECIYQ
jgi:hypothetical protein